MAAVVTVNDPILQPFLRAKDSDESQRELVILLSEHAESRIRGIIMSRLRSYPSSHEDSADFEDLYSETKTRLLAYLNELKADRRTVPCEDFRGYVAAQARVALMSASVGSLIRASGTFSIRTSPAPNMTVAGIVTYLSLNLLPLSDRSFAPTPRGSELLAP